MELSRKPGRILAFKHAFRGIVSAFIEEPNLKFHFFVALLIILAGWFFQINKLEWVATITIIGLVLTAELTNTSIEAVVDSFTNQEHPGAKLAKDISAGAVLIVSITAITVGLIIFLPYILGLLI